MAEINVTKQNFSGGTISGILLLANALQIWGVVDKFSVGNATNVDVLGMTISTPRPAFERKSRVSCFLLTHGQINAFVGCKRLVL